MFVNSVPKLGVGPGLVCLMPFPSGASPAERAWQGIADPQL